MFEPTRAVRLTMSISLILLAIALAAPVAPASAQVASGVMSGVWDTDFGELRLHQSADYVVGDYDDKGILLGRVSGTCVAGVFTNGERSGIFRWELRGGRMFRGQWAWHGESLSGRWRGRRTSASVPAFTNFTRDGSTTRTLENDRRVWDGSYQTAYGTLQLRARDLFLIGDYADRGILVGMWDGNNFVGRFTNGERVGWFRFPSNSASGSFGQGSWGWMNGEGGGQWDLTERNGATPRLSNMIDEVSCAGAESPETEAAAPQAEAAAPQAEAAAPVATAVFVGEWDTSFGKLRLHQFDGYVVGDYANEGILLGRVNGSCIAGVFTNDERSGIFRWQSTGPRSFRGQWAWHGESLGGSWQGTRSSAGVGNFRNFSRSGSRTTIRINSSKALDGVYATGYGTMRLRARDLFLIGDYADRGILAGMYDGSNFVGRFTNGERVGWFRFPANFGSGRFGQGRWGWLEGEGGGNWDLRKRNGATPRLTNMVDEVQCE